MSEHEDDGSCCGQSRQEQARLFQPRYNGSIDTRNRNQFSYMTNYKLNNDVDPSDEHHILRLRDKFIQKGHLCLVFELLSVNLYELIKQNQYRGLGLNLVRVFAGQLLDAMCVLKDARIIHCDLKPENILLTAYIPRSLVLI